MHIKFQLLTAFNSPAKVASRRAIEVASQGLAEKRLLCRFYVGVVEPYVSWYCPVLVVLAGFSSVSQ
jgi:hypothetical protein